MFEYLFNAPTSEAINATYYVIRLIRHRADVKDPSSLMSRIAEASAEDQKLISEILGDIQQIEKIPITDLSDEAADNYVLELEQIAEERSAEELKNAGVTAEKANELLKKMELAQSAEREISGLGHEWAGSLVDEFELVNREVRRHLRGRFDHDISGRYGRPEYGGERFRGRYPYDREYGRADYERGSYDPWYGTYRPTGYGRSDQHIANNIIDDLERRLGLEARNIQVFVNDGVVRLRGIVRDQQALRIAEQTAETTSGVNRVRSFLRVEQESYYRNYYRDRGYDYGSARRSDYGYQNSSRYRREEEED